MDDARFSARKVRFARGLAYGYALSLVADDVPRRPESCSRYVASPLPSRRV